MLTLKSRYNINRGRLLSSTELQALFLFGINVKDSTGQQLSMNTYDFHIASAQKEIEDTYVVKFKKQVVCEETDFNKDDFRSFSYMPTQYPVYSAVALEGFVGQILQVTYPREWISDKYSSDGETFYRQLFIVPNAGAPRTQAIVYSGLIPQAGYGFASGIPNYWRMTYITSFKKTPDILLQMVGKLAAIAILNIAGDIVLGTPGIAGQVLSIDGLQQRIFTTASPTSAAYSARISQYQREIVETDKKIRSRYKGMTLLMM